MTSLATEFKLGNICFRNRLVLPALTTNYATPDGQVTDAILRFYEKRSEDVGLMIVEATAVNEAGRIVPNSLGLWKDDQIAGMGKLCQIIHKMGALAVVQLNHAGPRCSPDDSLRQGLSPSGAVFRPDIDPIVMSHNDIETLITDFAHASIRAKKAGFDGVEIHGAHLYLLSQFISPLTNKRDDAYGKDTKGRAKLAVDIVKNVRKNVGLAYPIFFRINGVELMEGGLAFDDSVATARLLSEAGVDVFDVTLIAHGGVKDVDGTKIIVGSSALAKEKPSGSNISFTVAFKKEIGKPVIAVGKFGAGAKARHAVEDAGIDMVAVGRQMICDPACAKKMLAENDAAIIPCDECLACFASIGSGKPLACKVNRNLPL